MSSHVENREHIREAVREGYGRIARGETQSCCGTSSCCGTEAASDPNRLAEAIGYASDELAALPEGANLGLSCGNPLALASLCPGEVVVDLGSGAGFDVFVAGRRVGPEGRAIGIDMTPEMLDRARRNAAVYRDRTGLDNVEFRLGEIEHLPLPDNSADAVISNCVINLSPDKAQVWREIARVLKPGGRVSVSDIALLRPLPETVKQKVEALVGCVAGAVPVDETEQMMRAAGLEDIRLESRPGYIEALSEAHDTLYREIAELLPEGEGPADYITSLSATAVKAGSCCHPSCCA